MKGCINCEEEGGMEITHVTRELVGEDNKMKLNQEQKDLLIGILEKAYDDLDMPDVFEYGKDFEVLIEQAKIIKVQET